MIGFAIIAVSATLYATGFPTWLFWFWAFCAGFGSAVVLTTLLDPQRRRRRRVTMGIDVDNFVRCESKPEIGAAKVFTLPLMIGMFWLGGEVGYF